jgi:hypothetical protein
MIDGQRGERGRRFYALSARLKGRTFRPRSCVTSSSPVRSSSLRGFRKAPTRPRFLRPQSLLRSGRPCPGIQISGLFGSRIPAGILELPGDKSHKLSARTSRSHRYLSTSSGSLGIRPAGLLHGFSSRPATPSWKAWPRHLGSEKPPATSSCAVRFRSCRRVPRAPSSRIFLRASSKAACRWLTFGRTPCRNITARSRTEAQACVCALPNAAAVANYVDSE